VTSLLAALPAEESTRGVYQAASGTLQTGSWLLIALPALGAAVLLLGGRRTDRWGHWLAVALSWAAFVWAALLFINLLGLPAGERARDLHLFDWIPAGSFQLSAGLLLDPLSVTFVLLVTFVGSLILVYSVAYMEHDHDRRRFFAYLNLFVASMLLLVLADSYLLLYVGWEGVGLASYLLIGFWNYNPAYATAAKKAFVVNRVGDLGLSIALMIMFAGFGSVAYSVVLSNTNKASEGLLTAIGLMLLLGACGKSAQFPLQSWLGDAMAGPTPVSALIHAATMVTAGVYLVVRSGPIYEGAPDAALVVVIVGAITLLFGAIVGCAKDDIKKALAASTMSQIGYMMLAAGLGPVGYVYAILHLLTHGFFKAGMFLGAGSVMHGMNDSVDMRRFGGLFSVMRITALTFGAGWLAIIGFPFLSGFWSKDKIIETAFATGDTWRPWVFGLVALLGAGITAFYMSRLYFMTFLGKRRWVDDAHPHESPALMTVPLIVLALGSLFLGGLLLVHGGFQTWLEPSTSAGREGEPVLSATVLPFLTVLIVAAGVALAWRMYLAAPVPQVAPRGSVATRAARRDLYQDDVNEAVFMRPGQYLTRSLVFGDVRGIDGAVRGTAALIGGLAGRWRRWQTGFVRSYALSMLAGVLVLAIGVLVVQI
jgi:NADH-quinone oxidoreductase subunit L